MNSGKVVDFLACRLTELQLTWPERYNLGVFKTRVYRYYTCPCCIVDLIVTCTTMCTYFYVKKTRFYCWAQFCTLVPVVLLVRSLARRYRLGLGCIVRHGDPKFFQSGWFRTSVFRLPDQCSHNWDRNELPFEFFLMCIAHLCFSTVYRSAICEKFLKIIFTQPGFVNFCS